MTHPKKRRRPFSTKAPHSAFGGLFGARCGFGSFELPTEQQLQLLESDKGCLKTLADQSCC